MKFFIDTANVGEIRQAASLGLLDGVTTNPTLLARERRDPREVLIEISKIVDGPVSAEVVAVEAEAMVREALELRSLADNIVVKIPMTLEGLKAIRRLASEGVPTNCTLVFHPVQALMAAKAGATYASPFVGRLDDVSTPGMRLIEQICRIYRNYGFSTQVLVASVRSPAHVLEAALLGADVVTVPPGVLAQLASHPLTDRGLERFLADWEKLTRR